VSRRLAGAAALTAAAAVAAGAFGAHALAGRLEPDAFATWRTGSLYLAYGGIGGLALAALSGGVLGGRGAAAAGAVIAGSVWFAASLFALALGAPRWIGALTPLGGAAMILGFVFFAVAASRDGGAS
jgi:uncharacterized membrane protein YgdD (TMEM256/DUF423 family)